jgi:hypothetical protein
MRRVLIGEEGCAGEVNSGEPMLAGGGCVVRGGTPAKLFFVGEWRTDSNLIFLIVV